MHQLAATLRLWDLQHYVDNAGLSFLPRGYDADEVVLPAELYAAATDEDGTFHPISVEKITSKYCPTRRDLYLERGMGPRRDGRKTWGRVAGHLIEQYLKGVMPFERKGSLRERASTYDRVAWLADEYSEEFWGRHSTRLRALGGLAEYPQEDPDRLRFLLKQSARFELAMLHLDRALSMERRGPVSRLLRLIWPSRPEPEGPAIATAPEDLRISPSPYLGLGDAATPDFLVREPLFCIGEVKTGERLQDFHLLAVTGYALAYENQHNRDVNVGAVYFFQTHVWQMSFPQVYVFLIDDNRRRAFFDARNEAYSVLESDEPPGLAPDYEKHCRHCRFNNVCYPRNDS